MNSDARIYVAGHNGMVGSAIVRRLRSEGYTNLVLRSHAELDLTVQADVDRFFVEEAPEVVFMCAARVGGIVANNTYRAEFIRDNLLIGLNIVDAAHRNGVDRLMNFSSSCVYPREVPQPMREEYLWTGPLEPTNEPYAVAKLSVMSACRAYHDRYGSRFVTVLPTSLYGPNDDFDPAHAHVLGALFNKMHSAKVKGLPSVEVWGSGTPRRELMYVDDCADACLFLIDRYEDRDPINIGLGEDHSIWELANLVKETVEFEGDLILDQTKPDGVARKLMDTAKMTALGWKARVGIREGLRRTYADYVRQLAEEPPA